LSRKQTAPDARPQSEDFFNPNAQILFKRVSDCQQFPVNLQIARFSPAPRSDRINLAFAEEHANKMFFRFIKQENICHAG